jgi:hypothetical protein
MRLTETIIATLQRLSVEDQQKVLDTINRLPTAKQPAGSSKPNSAEIPSRSPIWAKLQAIGNAAEATRWSDHLAGHYSNLALVQVQIAHLTQSFLTFPALSSACSHRKGAEVLCLLGRWDRRAQRSEGLAVPLAVRLSLAIGGPVCRHVPL